jgi:hypothetical protein
MTKTDAGVVMPNLNQDEAVEKFATTAGAYTGALVTAGITGLFTFGAGLLRGAVAGAQNTWANGRAPQPVAEQDELAALRARLAQLEQQQSQQ